MVASLVCLLDLFLLTFLLCIVLCSSALQVPVRVVFQRLDAVILLERALVGASIDAENLVEILGAGARDEG